MVIISKKLEINTFNQNPGLIIILSIGFIVMPQRHGISSKSTQSNRGVIANDIHRVHPNKKKKRSKTLGKKSSTQTKKQRMEKTTTSVVSIDFTFSPQRQTASRKKKMENTNAG